MTQVLSHPLIIGGGPVGLVLALLLQQQGIAVTVLEALPQGAMYGDGRALALADGTRLLLQQLGVWARLQPSLTAIHEIHISQQKGLGRTRLQASQHGLPALGYVVAYGALMQALDAQLAQSDTAVQVMYESSVSQCQVSANRAEVVCTQANAISSRYSTPLAIVADGGRSLDAVPGLERETKAYGHDALVGLVKTTQPHGGVAYERFTPRGPMALLPNGDRYSLVWTGEQSYIDGLAALHDAEFLAALHAAFGDRAGQFVEVGKRMRFPLKMSQLRQPFLAHCVVIGNAAQTMHPVAGQGFNVGMRDASALAEAIVRTPSSRWGEAGMLVAYQQARRRDSGRGLLFTDFLVNVFSNEIPGVGLLRGAGLGVLGMLPLAQRLLVNKMSYGK